MVMSLLGVEELFLPPFLGQQAFQNDPSKPLLGHSPGGE